MDILYFHVRIPGLFGPLVDFKEIHCFYLPDYNLILARMQTGMMTEWGALESPELQALAQSLLNREDPVKQMIQYSNVRQIDYTAGDLSDLVRHARALAELHPKVKDGIEGLMKLFPNVYCST